MSSTEPTPEVEPTAEDLAAIEHEWPLIAAEIDELDAEIALLSAEPTALDWRRLRRAQARVIRAWIETTHRPACPATTSTWKDLAA